MEEMPHLLPSFYFRIMLGALGGLMGWLLFGALGDLRAVEDGQPLQQILAGALVGGAVSQSLAGSVALRKGDWLHWSRYAALGLALGGLGGALGFWVAGVAGSPGGRVLGWIVLGFAVGISEGAAERAPRLLVAGASGGAMGGLAGGLMLLLLIHGNRYLMASPWRQSLGLMSAGSCIGLFLELARWSLRPGNQERHVQFDGSPPALDMIAAHPFDEHPLQGAATLRELAAGMQAAPQAAAVLLERGALTRWFETNGWNYPVRGATAPGLAAVQQFFEVLGLAKAPLVELAAAETEFTCIFPERLLCTAALRSATRKWVFADVASTVAWLKVVTPHVAGVGQAMIEYELDSSWLPAGGTHIGQLHITANAGQQLVVQVRTTVHRPHQPFTRRLVRPLLTGAAAGLFVRMLLTVPADLIAPPFDEDPQGYVRRFVQLSWWWAPLIAAAFLWRQRRPWADVIWATVAAAGVGLMLSAAAACLVAFLDAVPRGLWQLSDVRPTFLWPVAALGGLYWARQ